MKNPSRSTLEGFSCDSGRDLCVDFNDNREADRLVAHFKQVATDLNAVVITTSHKSLGNGNAKGHFGMRLNEAAGLELSLKKDNKTSNLFINQRGCFWMKAFTTDMHSNSYSLYKIPTEIHPFVYCLVNSSLFFLLWIIVSDGWHITNKELSFIKIPSNVGKRSVWQGLMERLENKLEKTKVYVGTKQVDYEYKHKECKDIIDEIDDEMAKIYHLSETQLYYIKNFGLKYRLGDGA